MKPPVQQFALSCHWVPLRGLILFFSHVTPYSLSSYPEILKSLTHPHDSLCFNASMSLLCQEVQNWAKKSRYITDGRRVTSLHLLATLPNTAQEVLGFLCCKGTLWVHGQLGVHHDPLPTVCWAPSQPDHSHHVLVPEVIALAKWRCGKRASEMHHALSEAVNKTN